MNNFSNFTGYKINMQTSTVILYTRNKQSKTEIQKTSPFKMTLKILRNKF